MPNTEDCESSLNTQYGIENKKYLVRLENEFGLFEVQETKVAPATPDLDTSESRGKQFFFKAKFLSNFQLCKQSTTALRMFYIEKRSSDIAHNSQCSQYL